MKPLTSLIALAIFITAGVTALKAWQAVGFVPLTEGEGTFVYGSLYVPYDPLFGKPVSGQPTTEFWGLDTQFNDGANGIDVGRMEWRFGSDSGREKETIR